MKLKVIFLKDSRWGRRNDIKEVAPGLARNILLPRGEAVLATPGNLAKAEEWRRRRTSAAAAEEELANAVAAKLTDLTVTVKVAKAGATGQLFAKLPPSEVTAALIHDHGLSLPPAAIYFPEPIKTTGLHQATARLTGGREAPFLVLVTEETVNPQLKPS